MSGVRFCRVDVATGDVGLGEIFIDAGQVWKEIDQIRTNEIKFSTGAGIALMTPIGPIRLDYGYKLMPESFEENYNLHIGFYFAF